MRTYSDGLLKSDCFYDAHLLRISPAVAGLMIDLNRFHNSVAHDLTAINEDRRFSFLSLESITIIHPDLTAEQIVAAVKEKFDAAVAK